jgi:hypothetical protein
MTPTVQNLNAKLSPRPRPKTAARVAAANRHLARTGSSARIRKSRRSSGYRGGGYLIDV